MGTPGPMPAAVVPADLPAHYSLAGASATFVIANAAAYVLSIIDGRVTLNDFHISSALDEGMARQVGGLGMNLFVMWLGIMFLARFCYIWNRINVCGAEDGEKEVFEKWNRRATTCGLTGIVGGAAVAAFPVHTGFLVHISFAGKGQA